MERQAMTLNKLLAGALVVQLVILATLVASPAEIRTQPASAAQPFDHSNCQYPDRWTNPVDGCDNSDPAVPECIKAFSSKEGEDACIAAFVAEHEQIAIVETITPAQPQAAQCGGK
jgi:hypothetical protein